MLGCNRIYSTSYHPQANGIIERLHRHLKGALKAHNHIQWTELLPIVLLGMRSALKDDINATCAQLVYGTTLRLPSDLVTSDSINQTANSIYVTSLIQTMRSLNPVSTAQHGTQNIYINPSLKTCSHIFLRSDKVNPPLTPPYTGSHLVISRNDKNFIIDLNGKQSTVSIDRIKPAYLLADVTDHSDLVQTQTIIEKPVTAAPNPSIPYTTRYGRTAFGIFSVTSSGIRRLFAGQFCWVSKEVAKGERKLTSIDQLRYLWGGFTCGDWYPPVWCRTKKRYQLPGNVPGLQCGVFVADDLVRAEFPTQDDKSQRSVRYPIVVFIQVHSSAKRANRKLRCLALMRKLGVKITCGDWYLPIWHRPEKRYQLLGNVLGLQRDLSIDGRQVDVEDRVIIIQVIEDSVRRAEISTEKDRLCCRINIHI
ncbi:transposon Ty3-G Gag-Pol polyprotein [Trichonephila clavipes]|nr:transposon Ty3-G Gag-Pol polyprotein [Trichonephila clavipes]